jgi:adenylate kinase family enzyme
VKRIAVIGPCGAGKSQLAIELGRRLELPVIHLDQLDFATPICLYRVLRRRVQYAGRTRPDMAPGCPERFLDGEFPKFLRYVATFRRKHRPRILDKLATLDASQTLITLRTPREVRRFLAAIESRARRAPPAA